MTAPFERRFTDEQREAIIRMGGHGVSQPEIVRRVGEGFDGLAPFEVSLATVGRLIRAERARTATLSQSALSQQDPHAALRTLVKEQLTMLEQRQRQLRKELNRLGARKRLQEQPWIDKALRDVTASLASLERTARNLPAESNGKPEEDEPGLYERLSGLE